MTRGVRDHIRDRGLFDFEDIGEQAVKNIARSVRAFRVAFDPSGTTQLTRNVKGTEEKDQTSLSGAGAADSDAIELAFWQSVDASAQASDYQAYLDRFPQGAFVTLARARLEMPSPPPGPDREVELAFWDAVKDSDDPDMLKAYLGKFPGGEFTTLVKLKLRSS